MRLTTKNNMGITISSSLVLIFSTLFLGIFGYQLMDTSYQEHLNQIKSRGYDAIKQIQYIAPKFNQSSLQNYLETIYPDSDIFRYMLVMNANGDTLAHSDPKRRGMNFMDTGLKKVLKTGQMIEQVYSRDRNKPNSPFYMEKTIDLIAPLNINSQNGEIDVVVSIGISLKTVDDLYQNYLCSLVTGITIWFIMILFYILTGIHHLKRQKISQKRLKKRDEELNQSRKMDAIGQLAGGVAHDFNNMLSGILGATELLKLEYLNTTHVAGKSLQYIDIILRATKRASNLVDKLLNFGRKGKHIIKPVDLYRMIAETISLLSSTVDKRISIIHQKQDHNRLLCGDYTQLQNILINLCINASHAMPKGGEILVTTGRSHKSEQDCDESTFKLIPGAYCHIAVSDKGVGITPEDLPKIFEPFFTTKNSHDTHGGTGLGLSAVYGIVQDHHGEITVESVVGEGTTFHLYLPMKECDEQIDIREKELITPGSGMILVVDDEKMIRMTTKAMLERLDYQVLLAKNGVEGIALFRKHQDQIKLVMLDMMMPAMTGQEVFFELRKINPEVNIIIASGFTQDKDLKTLFAAGLAGFIPKPFQLSQLSQALSDILKKTKPKTKDDL